MPDTALPRLLALLLLTPLAVAQQRKCIFDAPMVVADKHHVFQQLGDFDADGFVDAIGFWPEVTNSNAQTGLLACWFNDGLGKLEVGYDLPTQIVGAGLSGGGTGGHGVGDVDEDGLPDFVYAAGNQLRVFLSRGRAAPIVHAATLPTGIHHSVGIGDFDADGNLEIVIASSAGLSVYRWELSLQTPVLAATRLGNHCCNITLLSGRFDGDTTLDFALAVDSNVELISFASGAIQSLGTFTVPASPQMMSAGDVDGDGDDDIVNFGMSSYSVLRRTGPTSWSLEASRVGGPATNFADVDGDGDLDGVCCGGGGRITQYTDNNSYFRVSHNDGTGLFAPAFEIPGVGALHIAGVADLEHDGDMDLVGGRCVYYAEKPLTAQVLPRVVDQVQEPRTVADLDRDGDPDFLALSGATVANLGDGSTGAWPNVLPSPPPGGTWAAGGYRGDFDGDGATDLLFGLVLGGSTTLELLSNCGGGSFAHRGQAMDAVPGDLDPRKVHVVDFDADGDLDLVVPLSSYLYGSDVYANDGAGHFTHALTIPDHVMNLADLDGDGDLDAIVARANGYSALWLARNLGGGAFAPPVMLSTHLVWIDQDQLAIADLDADGDIDLLWLRQNASIPLAAVLLTNDGAGNFTQSAFGSAEYGPNGAAAYARQATALDADGDGLLDVVIGPVFDARMAVDVFLRKHDNSGWLPPIRQTIHFLGIGFAPRNSSAVCDVDGDGDLDLVTDRLVRNRSFIPSTTGHRRQLGASGAGSGGVLPTLGASGPFRTGSTATLRLTGARPLTTGRLYAARTDAPASFPGLGTHTARGLTWIVPFTTTAGNGSVGAGTWSHPFPVPAALATQSWSYSIQIDDPAGPQGRVETNALELVFGP